VRRFLLYNLPNLPLDPPSLSCAYEFVKRNEALKGLIPTQLDMARLRATTPQNVEPFLLDLRQLIKENNYDENLIF
jgi:hypothetical protein